MTCKDKQENNGVCPHHNLQCGWPKCNEPEQEPVAWVNQANLNSAAIQRNRGGQGDTHTWSETPNAFCPIPLYTTPPQRKPLKFEEMDAVIDGCPKYHGRFSTKDPNGKLNYYELIRAIEAAHGIKE